MRGCPDVTRAAYMCGSTALVLLRLASSLIWPQVLTHDMDDGHAVLYTRAWGGEGVVVGVGWRHSVVGGVVGVTFSSLRSLKSAVSYSCGSLLLLLLTYVSLFVSFSCVSFS